MPDQVSFDDFYVATRGAVLGQLTAMTLDRELAADAVQEAYTRAWQRWARVAHLDDPAAWVRTVAWRVAVSHFRRRAVAERLLPRVRAERSASEAAFAAASEAAFEVGLDVVAALRAMSPEHRRVLVLHEMVGMPVRAIASETGLSEGTIKSRLSRARERLGVALGPDYLSGGEPAAVDAATPAEER